MKKLNKKGFTLVELLAVIVVLALIMVLILPNVMDSMNSAKQQTFLLYANRMLDAAMNKRASDELAGGNVPTCYEISYLNNGNTNKYKGFVQYVKDSSGKYVYKISMYNDNFQIGFTNTTKNSDTNTIYDKAGGVTSADIETIKDNLKNNKATLLSPPSSEDLKKDEYKTPTNCTK
mgnify:CR=1 FL=1